MLRKYIKLLKMCTKAQKKGHVVQFEQSAGGVDIIHFIPKTDKTTGLEIIYWKSFGPISGQSVYKEMKAYLKGLINNANT